ncbi:tyrosine-type recombinase/integrase [Asticcacaulis benevestitus]|uniref:Integrase n=1 Tax=Asticcacaulis benevestitus DSM 16100 = ATCC BAA-896 TaxID=1121022 RepID=V4PCU8_9CAUL|nr:integrase arm-type DNA-binding domain-containing protein [Asticcacaulis benevestitus]ESQ84959.1 integrase [Asticcacaulis benevestitus DSM 16100 = ATCC BAA-896]
MALSDTAIRNAKPRDKQYKLYDEKGLFMILSPAGGKWWRFKYTLNGKEQQLTVGVYPDVGLKEARLKRDEARKLLAAGIDPGADKKRKAVAATMAAENTFKAVAEEFITKREREGLAEVTIGKAKWLLSLLEPSIGRQPISDIEPYELLAALKEVEARGTHETAKRMRAFAARVFRYAIITGRARHNPAADLGEALISPKVTHHAAIIEPKAVGALLRAIDGYEGNTTTKLALRLAPHVFVRPGELRHAEWSEIDFDAAVWRIPPAKMKMRQEHAVPLSRQAIAILKEGEAVRGHSKYVFPALRTWLRPMSENTLNAALRRLGYSSDEMTSHGFRSTASTLLNESGKWAPDAIERALAHKDGDNVRAAYHRGTHWDERVKMAQWWSDYLDELRHKF